jgi:hypothetical protein
MCQLKVSISKVNNKSHVYVKSSFFGEDITKYNYLRSNKAEGVKVAFFCNIRK